MAKKQRERSILIGIDIAEIVIGLVIFIGLGLYALNGVFQHIQYLTADDKITTTGKYVSETSRVSNLKERDSDGNESNVYFYDITYEYTVDGKRYTFIAKDRPSSSKADRTLYLYRNGDEDYRDAPVAGMWAAVQWVLLIIAVLLGARLMAGGVRGLLSDRKKG